MPVTVSSLGTKTNGNLGINIQFSYADGLRGTVGEWIVFTFYTGVDFFPDVGFLVVAGQVYDAYLSVYKNPYGIDTQWKVAIGWVRVPSTISAGDYIQLEDSSGGVTTTIVSTFYRVSGINQYKPTPSSNWFSCDTSYSLNGSVSGRRRIGTLYYVLGVGTISSVTLQLQRIGNPTGIAFVSLRDARDDSIIGILANIDVATIQSPAQSSTPGYYVFDDVPVTNSVVRPVRIQIEYTGGDASNYIKVYAQSKSIPSIYSDNGLCFTSYYESAYHDLRRYQQERPLIWMEVSGGYILDPYDNSNAALGETDTVFEAIIGSYLGTLNAEGKLAVAAIGLEAPYTEPNANMTWEGNSDNDVHDNSLRSDTQGAWPERILKSVATVLDADEVGIRATFTNTTASRKGYILLVLFMESAGSPSPSPSISQSRSISPSASISPSISKSASVSPSISKSASISPSASVSPSISKSASVSPSISPSASISPSISPSGSISPSASASPSPMYSVDDVTLRFVASPSLSPSASFSPSASISLSASVSPSVSPSISESASRSPSASLSPSASPSPSPADFLIPPPACNINSRQHIVLKDQNGNNVALFDSFIRLEYEKKVNDVGYFVAEFYDEPCDDRFDVFELDGQIEVWRSIPGADVDWYREFEGLFRKPRREIDSDGRRRFIASGVGYNHLLSRRTIAYKQGTIYAEKDDYTEDVMKEYVYENAGAGAGEASRIASGIFPNFTVEAESAYHNLTPVWRGERSFNSLLDVVQELANYSMSMIPSYRAVDFAVVSNGDGAFIFRTYLDQLGSDRTEDSWSAVPVIFSVEFGNLQEASSESDRLSEVTRVIVLGKGDMSTRTVIYREDISVSDDSPWNVIEVARPASLNEFTYQLEDFGDASLKELRKKEIFEAVPLQTPSTLYGLHYFLGDVVTVRHMGVSYDKKIMGVKITYEEEGREVVSVEWEDVTP